VVLTGGETKAARPFDPIPPSDPAPALAPASKFVGNRGVTLLELIMALALTGLVAAMAVAFWKDAGNAARLTKGRMEAGFQAQALFTSLCENLLAGGGVLSVGPNDLVLVNAHKRRLEYKWSDSTLSVNGKPLGIRIGLFEVAAIGPERPVPEGSSLAAAPSWDLDSLDDDRDGHIDFQELDRNRSGELDLDECRFVASYRITLTIVDGNIPKTLTGLVHPRNHANSQTARDAGGMVGNEGIPEF